MSLDTSPHYPVMLNEVISSIKQINTKTIVDCTFGCGGYSNKLLEAFPNCKIIAIDRDPTVKKFADILEKKFKKRFYFINDKFSKLESVINEHKKDVGSFIFDFGISSFQLDDYSRGFSFNSNVKLDMRMGQNRISAYDLLNEAPIEDLNSIIKIFGEDKDHKKIATEIVRARGIFQAIRMIVNQELSEIFKALKKTIQLSSSNTVITAVTFHSLEDRIVKKLFNVSRDYAQNPSRYVPIKHKDKKNTFLKKTSNKAIKASKKEVISNPRARSAKLRSVMKMGKELLEINRKALKMEKLFQLEEKYNV